MTSEQLIILVNQIITYFQEYIREHPLTNYCDDTDPYNVKETDCYLVPQSEVDNLQDLFKKAALERWGIKLEK